MRAREPARERLERVGVLESLKQKRMRGFAGKLAVDEGIVEARDSRLISVRCEVDGVDACPVTRRKTHWTRLAGAVDVTAGERVRAERAGRRTQSDDLRVCGRVERDRDRVRVLRDDYSMTNDPRPERTPSGFAARDRELE